MKKVRIGDFPLGKDEHDAIQRVVDSGRITEHKEVRAFEEEFAEWIGAKHCVALSSGTAALMTGLMTLKYSGKLKSRSSRPRVLIPALTFIATANAIRLCNMMPVFGDVDTLNMCLAPTYINGDMDIVMPVHLFGFMPDMRKLKWETQVAGAILVEDACEAHGSTYRGKKAGTFGLWGAFSFFIAHTIQAGELGALVTDDNQIATLARRIKAHGRECACKICTRPSGQCPNMKDHDPRYCHLIPGYNFKPMEFSAALARVQLKKVNANIERRYTNAVRLTRGLRHLEHALILPYLSDNVSYMMYPLILKQNGHRDKLLIELEKRDIECRPLFGCIPLQQPAYKHLAYRYKGKLPVSEYYGTNGFFVGCHQYLTDDDIDRIIKTISEVVRMIHE